MSIHNLIFRKKSICRDNLLYLLIFSLFLDACNIVENATDNNNPEEIDVNSNNEKAEFNSFFKLSKVVPLETSKDCYIVDIKKIYLSISWIYILDKNKYILVFSIDGKFIKRIENIGSGPGEWQEIYDFDIQNNDSILILRSQFKELVYTTSGNFISEEKVDIPAYEFYKLKNHSYVYYFENTPSAQNTIGDNTYNVIIQKVNEQSKLYCRSIKCMNGVSYSQRYARHLCQTKENIYVVESYNDTIYSIDNEANFIPKYRIDFGDKKYPVDELHKYSDIDKYNKHYAHFIANIYETSDILFFSYNNGLFPTHVIYKKDEKKSLNGIFYADTINNIPLNIINYYGTVESVLSLLEPESYFEFIEEKEKELGKELRHRSELQNLKEADNPILVFYSFIQR